MDTNQETTSSQPNRPALTHRDKDLKCTVWRNQGDKGDYFTTTLSKTYTDQQGNARDTHNLSQTDLLRGAELMRETYSMISDLRREHSQNQNRGQENTQNHTQHDTQVHAQGHTQGDLMSDSFDGQSNPQSQSREAFKQERRQENGHDPQKGITF